MATTIATLTDAQRDAIPTYVERWISIGLSTEPADRELAEVSLRAMYAFADLAEPEILWVNNPQEMAKLLIESDTGSAIESAIQSAVENAVRIAIQSTVESAVRIAVRSAVEDAVRIAVDSTVRSAVEDAVRIAVDSTVGNVVEVIVGNVVGNVVDSTVGSVVEVIVGSVVGGVVESAIRNVVGSAVQRIVWDAYDGGQTWVSWCAQESFFREICNLELPGDLSARRKALSDYRSSVGPGFLFEKVAILYDRPANFEPLTWRE